MYIYAIKIHAINEENKKIVSKNKHPLSFLPIKKIEFPENYIKIFLAEEKPEQIIKEHNLIYNGLKIEVKFFSQKSLVQNFEKIKNFFHVYQECSLIYHFQEFDKIDKVFNHFLTILNYCSPSETKEEKNNSQSILSTSSHYSIYNSLKNVIEEIKNKKSLYNSFIDINKNYNPCCKSFEKFTQTRDYQLLNNLYQKNNLLNQIENNLSREKTNYPETETKICNSKNCQISKKTIPLHNFQPGEENIIFLIDKLKQTNNTQWYKNVCSLEKIIQKEETNNFNIVSFSNLDTTILSFEENNNQILTYSEFCLKETEESSHSDLVIVFKELFSGQKRLEYDSIKIKLLEKGYFSEFEILSEFVIPKNDKIIHYLKEQIEEKDWTDENYNIQEIENLLINFNECIENNDELIYKNNITYEEYKKKDFISHSDQKKLINIRRIRVLKNYLFNYTQRKENEKMSVSRFFDHFVRFLTIYYPGYNNYFHYRNFSGLLKELGYKTQRKNDGSFVLNLEIKDSFF